MAAILIDLVIGTWLLVNQSQGAADSPSAQVLTAAFWSVLLTAVARR